jgi:hypothetical protein
MQFKSFPIAMITRHWRRMLEGGNGADGAPLLANRFTYGMALMATTVGLGAIATQAKQILAGKDPIDMTDEDTAARIVLVDNRSNDLAAYDDHALLDLLQSLPDLAGTGFDGDSLDELLALRAKLRAGIQPVEGTGSNLEAEANAAVTPPMTDGERADLAPLGAGVPLPSRTGNQQVRLPPLNPAVAALGGLLLGHHLLALLLRDAERGHGDGQSVTSSRPRPRRPQGADLTRTAAPPARRPTWAQAPVLGRERLVRASATCAQAQEVAWGPVGAPHRAGLLRCCCRAPSARRWRFR